MELHNSENLYPLTQKISFDVGKKEVVGGVVAGMLIAASSGEIGSDDKPEDAPPSQVEQQQDKGK